MLWVPSGSRGTVVSNEMPQGGTSVHVADVSNRRRENGGVKLEIVTDLDDPIA